VWHHQTRVTIGLVDAEGIVLEVRRRGYRPLRHRLNPLEASYAIETDALRPARVSR
jgi:hypothetical protein